ncbi:hypothetical protein C8R45DRAFT_98755 [Mycena sanguinolenta]|nr:hypothetical protein C8R45DRAFT_98755 [Mycena sanguinolenta]
MRDPILFHRGSCLAGAASVLHNKSVRRGRGIWGHFLVVRTHCAAIWAGGGATVLVAILRNRKELVMSGHSEGRAATYTVRGVTCLASLHVRGSDSGREKGENSGDESETHFKNLRGWDRVQVVFVGEDDLGESGGMSRLLCELRWAVAMLVSMFGKLWGTRPHGNDHYVNSNFNVAVDRVAIEDVTSRQPGRRKNHIRRGHGEKSAIRLSASLVRIRSRHNQCKPEVQQHDLWRDVEWQSQIWRSPCSHKELVRENWSDMRKSHRL